jgi:hypothetical protein
MMLLTLVLKLVLVLVLALNLILVLAVIPNFKTIFYNYTKTRSNISIKVKRWLIIYILKSINYRKTHPLKGWDKKVEEIIEYKNLYDSCLWRSFKKGINFIHFFYL